MQPDIKELLSDFLPSSESSGPEHVLGLFVAERHLHALLIERSSEGTRVERRFTRQRGGAVGGGGGFGGGGEYGMGQDTGGDDFDIQFGGGGGGGGENIFLGSEFGDLDNGGDEADYGSFGGGEGREGTASFALELSDLLDECRSAGYGSPGLAFCLPAPEVTQREVVLDDVDADEAAPPSVQDVGAKTLRKALEEQHGDPIDEGRVAFLPMTPSGGSARFLALIGRIDDPVVSTLRPMKERGDRLPGYGLLETEISLYFGLARTALDSAGAAQEDALVVRVGEDDTLALFTSGRALRHAETLRSLTASDASETVCSRVLLLQDEYGIADMQHVLVCGDEQEDALVESFEMFFPEAHVESLRSHLPSETTAAGEDHAAASVSATAAALRLAEHASYDRYFEDVDLLPSKLLKPGFELPFSNAVPILLVLLAVAGIFFGVRYNHMVSEQEEVRQRLAAYPDNFTDSTPNELQADIDSVQSASARYLEGLEVLDNLLMGSDQWSHALAEISRETAAVSGIWVEQWTPRSGAVQLSGNATGRERIVELAERTEGEIQSATFSEIREWPVYSFTMQVPLKTGLPEATKYLREQALAESSSPGASGQNAGGQPDTTQ